MLNFRKLHEMIYGIGPEREEAVIDPMGEALRPEHKKYRHAPVEILNDECLAEIFSYLPITDKLRAEGVCKRWQSTMKDAWRRMRRMDLSNDTWHLPLRNIMFDGISYNIMKQIYKRCGRYLTSIDLFYMNDRVELSSLFIISRYCPNVERLTLAGYPMLSKLLYALSKNCHKITKLSLGECRDSSESGLARLFCVNPNLKCLTFNRTFELPGKCLKYIPNTIEELKFKHCYDMRADCLNAALEKFVNLTTLTFVSCSEINNATLEVIGKLTKIVRLSITLELAPPISSISMFHLANLVNLTQLTLRHPLLVTDHLLFDISVHCTQLRELDVWNCRGVSDRGATAIVENAEHLLVLVIVGTYATRSTLQAADRVTARRKKQQLFIFYTRNGRYEDAYVPHSEFLRVHHDECLLASYDERNDKW